MQNQNFVHRGQMRIVLMEVNFIDKEPRSVKTIDLVGRLFRSLGNDYCRVSQYAFLIDADSVRLAPVVDLCKGAMLGLVLIELPFPNLTIHASHSGVHQWLANKGFRPAPLAI